MSSRFAYRPRYQLSRYRPHPSLRSHKEFLSYRWTYRQQTIRSQKRIPGQGLLSMSWVYRLKFNTAG
jgi:hypothetical protein